MVRSAGTFDVMRTYALRAASIAVLCLGATQCGTSAVGVDACKQIESARCTRAASCQVPLDTPNHTSETDVQSCIDYYDVACLHGLTVADPGGSAVGECVNAIQTGPCDVVTSPQSAPACAWLSTATSEEASTDASADVSSDTAAEATADASVDADAAGTADATDLPDVVDASGTVDTGAMVDGAVDGH